MPETDLNSLAERLPSIAVVVPIAALIMGMALWLMGGRLLRVGCALSSLVLGGLGGFVAAVHFSAGQLMILWIVGGAVAGTLLAWLLFRLWMGLTVAMLLAAVVPASVLIWQDAPPIEPTATEALRTHVSQLAGGIEQPLDPSGTDESPAMEERLSVLGTLLTDAVREQLEAIARWWNELEPQSQKELKVTAGIGAAVGLALGLILPNFSAASLTSLAGSLLMLLGGNGLMTIYAPNQARLLQQHPRATLITLGLITFVGFLIQWTIWRRTTDK